MQRFISYYLNTNNVVPRRILILRIFTKYYKFSLDPARRDHDSTANSAICERKKTCCCVYYQNNTERYDIFLT
jgi:hypothetical protein